MKSEPLRAPRIGTDQTRQYDSIGRIERVENQFTTGYVWWYYTPVRVVTVTKLIPLSLKQ